MKITLKFIKESLPGDRKTRTRKGKNKELWGRGFCGKGRGLHNEIKDAANHSRRK